MEPECRGLKDVLMVNRPFLLPLWLLTIAAAAEMFVGSATAYTGPHVTL